MLGKVMKYELQSCGRVLLPFFGLVLVLSGVLRLLFWLAPMIWAPVAAVLTGFLALFTVLLLIAAVFAGIAVAVVRFYRGMVTTEGYLSFTLPVTTGTHVAGRFIVGALYGTLGFLVALGSVSILVPSFWPTVLYAPVFTFPGEAGYSLSTLPAGHILSIAGIALAVFLLSVISSLAQIYASIAIGTKITKNRLGGSIIGYLIVNTVQGLLMTPLMMAPFIGMLGRDDDAIGRYVMSLIAGDVLTTTGNVLGFAWLVVGIVALVSLVFAAVQYWLTWLFLDKKLNLE